MAAWISKRIAKRGVETGTKPLLVPWVQVKRLGMGLLVALFALGAVPGHAAMYRSLLRSPEALAMGGAYTAIAEGRDAPFYNPAGVAANDRLAVHFANIDATVSDWVISGWKTMEDLKDPSGSDFNRLMGENIFIEATVSTAVLAPGFALVGFYDTQGALYAKNQAFPKIEYGYQTTSGVQLAFAGSTSDGHKRGLGKKNGEYLNEWRYGVGAKYLTRRGGYRFFPISELFAVDQIDTESLLGGKGSGYGFDFGVQRLQRLTPEVALQWGAAFLNAGDVHFGNGATPVKGDLSTGVAVIYTRALASLTLAYDFQQINRSADFGKHQNLGVRVGLPLVDLYGGLHQGFLTYGAAVDVWVLRVAAAVYKEELGFYPRQDVESRTSIRADFKMEF